MNKIELEIPIEYIETIKSYWKNSVEKKTMLMIEKILTQQNRNIDKKDYKFLETTLKSIRNTYNIIRTECSYQNISYNIFLPSIQDKKLKEILKFFSSGGDKSLTPGEWEKYLKPLLSLNNILNENEIEKINTCINTINQDKKDPKLFGMTFYQSLSSILRKNQYELDTKQLGNEYKQLFSILMKPTEVYLSLNDIPKLNSILNQNIINLINEDYKNILNNRTPKKGIIKTSITLLKNINNEKVTKLMTEDELKKLLNQHITQLPSQNEPTPKKRKNFSKSPKKIHKK